MKYTTILHDIRKKYWLSMNEYAVADSIFMLSSMPNFNWKINRTYLSDFLVINRTNIIRIINKLIWLWLLEKWWNNVTDLWKNEVLWNATVEEWEVLWNATLLDTNCCETQHNNNIIYKYNYNNNLTIPPISPKGDCTDKEKKVINKLLLSLDEIINIWNSVEDKFWIKFKAPPNTNIYKQLLSSYNAKKKTITNEEFYSGLDNYLLEISKRKPENESYYKHRFALHLFMKQSNWLEKFIYSA